MSIPLFTFLRNAGSLFRDFQNTARGSKPIHCSFESDDVVVVIFSKRKKTYEEVSDGHRRIIHAALGSCLSILGMNSLHLLDYATSPVSLGYGKLRTVLMDYSSVTRKRLASCGYPRSLTPLQCVSVLLTREYTERDAAFIKRFFGGLPSLEGLRKARWSLLKSFSRLWIMEKSTNNWKQQPEVRFITSSYNSKNIQ